MSFDLVLFGGTGDLTWRKLMPALFQAFRHGKLPEGGRILAVARDERSDDEYRNYIRARFADVEAPQAPQRRGVRALRGDAALPTHGPLTRLSTMPGSSAGSNSRVPKKGAAGDLPTRWCCSWPPARTCSPSSSINWAAPA
jgi:hypothetical protein